MKGSTNRKRLRPSVNSSQPIDESVLHSTPIDPKQSKRLHFELSPDPPSNPIRISAPSGFPNFSAVLQQHGFLLAKPRNQIGVDQLVFRKRLSDWITEKKQEEPVSNNEVAKFITAMTGYLSIKENLDHSLTPTLHADEVFQASLLHNLLCIAGLQTQVFKILLPVVSETTCIASTQADVDRLVSILNQMKWLPNVSDMTGFTSVLLDISENATPLAQKEMVRFLPDIIAEKYHSKVAATLKRMMDSGSEIVSALMDCFSSLDISEAEWESIRGSALTQMFCAPLQDFPAYFAFLFRTEEAAALAEIISEMREKLELIPFGEDTKNTAYMVEIVEKVRFCGSVNPNLVPLWSKQVKDSLHVDGEVKPLDLIMLLIFAESFKAPLIPLKAIFFKNRLSADLLDHVLEHNLPIINQVFSTFAKICDTFLRGRDSKAQAAIEHVYIKLFVALGPIEAQEIASDLISILMNGHVRCKDSVLKILASITEECPEKVLLFAPHIMSILEGVMKFPPHLIRKLMNILAKLSHIEGSADSERFGTEFAIFLRKQLTHTNAETRCFGVLAALANVQQLSNHPRANAGKIRELINLAWSFVQREDDPCSLFFDELSDVVQFLPRDVAHYTKTVLKNKFMESWTVPETSVNSTLKNSNLKVYPQFEANKELAKPERRSIAFEERPLGMNPKTIPAHFRVVRLFEANSNSGMLADIGLLLGCSLVLPDFEVYCNNLSKLTACTFNQRLGLGNYLGLTINYMRECISAFVEQKSQDVDLKIWYRLSNVVCLQRSLVHGFAFFPSLPEAYVTGRVVGFNDCKANEANRKERKVQKLKKKHKGDIAEENTVMDQETVGTTTSSADSRSSLENSVQPSFLIPYLRRFDQKVFCLLEYPLVASGGFNTNLLSQLVKQKADKIKESDYAELRPETLSLLLLELIQQSSNPAIEFSIFAINNLLQSLCKHMNTVTEFLRGVDQIDRNRSRNYDECFGLLLRALNCYVGKIKDSSDDEIKEAELCKLVEALGSQNIPVDQEAENEMSQIELVQRAGDYLNELSNSPTTPATAIEHLKVLSNFQDLIPTCEHVSAAVEAVAEKYLKRKWKLSATQVDFILRTWIKKSSDPLSVLQTVTTSLTGTSKIPRTNVFQSCTESTFNTWYNVLFSSLAQIASKQGKEMSQKNRSPTAALEFWMKAVSILKDLVHVTQTVRKNSIFTPLLRSSRHFLEALISHGINLMPSMCTASLQDLKTFTQNLQGTTRKIQTVCEYSKVKKETALTRYVPLVKRVLEALVFRVREVLAVNGISAAFWMGALRHRNMDGEVVDSQPCGAAEEVQLSRRSPPSETETDLSAVESEASEDEESPNTEINDPEPGTDSEDERLSSTEVGSTEDMEDYSD